MTDVNSATSEAPVKSPFPWVMRGLGVLYILSAFFFLLFPNEIFYLINVGPKVFNVTQAIPEPMDRFWLISAASQMITLSALSFLAAQRPMRKSYVWVHLLAKGVACAGYVSLFAYQQQYFAYLIGATLEALIAIVILWHWIRALSTATGGGQGRQ